MKTLSSFRHPDSSRGRDRVAQVQSIFRNPFRLFRFKSIFATILVAMISLSLVLSGIFAFFFTGAIIRNTAEQRAHTNQANVRALVGNADYMIRSLHQSLTQLSYSSNVYKLAFAAGKERFETNLAMTEVARTKEHNPLIHSAFVYVPGIDAVLTSTYQEYVLADYPDRSRIDAFLAGPADASSIGESSKKSTLFFSGGEFVLAQDFPLNGEKRLAASAFLIDMHEMYRLLTAALPEEASLWVFTADNRPVFAAEADYPAEMDAAELTPVLFERLDAAESRSVRIGSDAVFGDVSDVTGWKFLYVVDESVLRPTANSVTAILLPILAGILVFSCLVSLLVASRLYRPFQRLLAAIDRRNLAPQASQAFGNEVDYLNYAFTAFAEHQTGLQNIVRSVSRDVTARLFSDLLAGRQMSRENAEEILSNIQSPFRIDATWLVCVLQCAGEQPLTEGQRLVVLSELKDITGAMQKNNGAMAHVLAMDVDRYAVVVSYDRSVLILRIMKDIGQLEAAFQSLARMQGFTPRFSAGHPYRTLLDIGFSYREAMLALATEYEGSAATAIGSSMDARHPTDKHISDSIAGSPKSGNARRRVPAEQKGTAKTGRVPDLETGMETDMVSGLEPCMETDMDSGLEPCMESGRESSMDPGTVFGMEPGTEPGMEPGTEPGMEPDTEPDLQRRASQILSLVVGKDASGAKLLAERVLDDISSQSAEKPPTEQKNAHPQTQDGGEQARRCEAFLTAIVDRISKLEYVDCTAIPNELLTLEASGDPAAVSAAAKEAAGRIIDMLQGMLKKQQHRILVAAQSYIQRNYQDSGLALNNVADAIGASPGYLSKLFVGNLGTHFKDYLNEIRIRSSVRQLAETNKAVKDIAIATGFSSAQTYIRVFKSLLGKTPGQYREEAVGRNRTRE